MKIDLKNDNLRVIIINKKQIQIQIQRDFQIRKLDRMIMSNKVTKNDAEKKEHHDKPEVVEEKIEQLADLIRDSKNVVVFTGDQLNSKVANPKFRAGFPTKGHMALKELVDRDIVKAVVSFNTDGLHLKSGIPKRKLIEINGNTFMEKCEKCQAEYMRDFRVTESDTPFDHKTSRTCDNKKCGGRLHDCSLHYAEYHDQKVIQ